MNHALRRLRQDQIDVGTPLEFDVYDEQRNLLLRKGQVICSEKQRDTLLERGVFADPQHLDDKPAAAGPINPFWLWNNLERQLARLLKEIAVQTEGVDYSDALLGIVSLLQTLCDKDPDAGLACLTIQDAQEYPIRHSLESAILVEMLGRRLNWDAAERRTATVAALTMNVSILELQARLCVQKSPLTEEQRRDIHSHPERSVALLQAAGVNNRAWLDAVLAHHETPDGRGSPGALTDVAPAALLIHTADVFSAKLSERATRRALAPNKALKMMLESAQPFERELISVLIKEVGIFPPGTLVKLGSGELGIVLKRGKLANTPTVAALVNPQGIPYAQPLRRETSKQEHQIVSQVPQEKCWCGSTRACCGAIRTQPEPAGPSASTRP